MAKQRVIAYYMHEGEREAAMKAMTPTAETDSFIIGDMEDSDIAALLKKGVIVNEIPPAAPPVEEDSPLASPKSLAVRFGLSASAVVDFEDAVPAAEDFYTVELRGPLLEDWRRQVVEARVKLLRRDKFGRYKARLNAKQVAELSAMDFVARVKWITPKRSVPNHVTQSVSLAPGAAPPTGLKMLTFDVCLNLPEDSSKVINWLRERNVAIAGTSGRKIRFFSLENSPVLVDLAVLPEVDTIAEYVEPELFNDAARRILGVDGAAAGVRVAQDGTDQIVAVADTGIDDTHPDFAGRIIAKIARGRTNDTTDPDGHGTHVTGSILGDGSASKGLYKGIAPKAKLFFQSLLDPDGRLGGLPLDFKDLFEEAYLAGARIHNNSWGSRGTPSMYTMNSEEVDEFVRDNPDMLIVIAAGNEGSGVNPRKAAPGYIDWLSICSPASCKNALTVGASRSDRTNGPVSGTTWGQYSPNRFPQPPIANETVSGNPDCLAAFSSRGPTDDRRIKPDVVAPGTEIVSCKSALAPISNFLGRENNYPQYAYDCGTSMATPLVSGCSALVRQYYVQTRGHQPSAALLKATLVNSARWLKGGDSIAPATGKPNYHQGHGRVDISMAIPNPSKPNLQLQFVDDWQDKTKSFTRTGDRRRFQFILPAGAPELRICMAYTDAPGRALQNNLNLMVHHLESNTKWMGNQDLPDALVIPDPDNNVEAIQIANPAQGTYFIQVFVGNLLHAPQDFALLVTGAGLPALTEI